MKKLSKCCNDTKNITMTLVFKSWLQNVNQKKHLVFFSSFYRWSLFCWTFWSWLSCGSAGHWSCHAVCGSHGYPTVPLDGWPMQPEASACESLRSIIVATWKGPVHLMCFSKIGIWIKLSKQVASFALKWSSQAQCIGTWSKVFNGWPGKSRSVQLEGRDLVSTEECAKDFPAICGYDQVYGMQPQQQSIEYRYATALHWSLTQFTPATATWQRFFSAWFASLSCLAIISIYHMQSFDSREETQESLVFRSSLSPKKAQILDLFAGRWMYILRIWWSALLLFSYWFLALCFFRPKLKAIFFYQ